VNTRDTARHVDDIPIGEKIILGRNWDIRMTHPLKIVKGETTRNDWVRVDE